MYSLQAIPVILFIVITMVKCEEPPDVLIQGVFLENNNSSICSEVLLEDQDNFQLCTFIQLKNDSTFDDRNATIFHLRNGSEIILDLIYGNFGHFTIYFRELEVVYLKQLDFNDWTHLCITVITVLEGFYLDFEINYRTAMELSEYSLLPKLKEQDPSKMQPKSHDVESYNRYKEINPKFDKHLNSNLNTDLVHLCAGSFTGSLAGTRVKSIEPNISDPNTKDSCIHSEKSEMEASFPLEFTNISGSFKVEQYNLLDLCLGTHMFLLLEEALSYAELSDRCSSINGRILLQDEATFFLDKLRSLYSRKTRNYQNLTNQINSLVFVDPGSVDQYYFDCSAVDLLDGTFSTLACMTEIDFAICVVAKYSDIFYFGSLKKFDPYYTVRVKNDDLFLKGNHKSWIEKVNNAWVLRSQVHKRHLVLQNATVPIGRNMWKDFNQKTENLITFTYCGNDQFTCSSGACLPLESRCNGIEECLDASDEEQCTLINKKSGYSLNKIPPPRKNESELTIKYIIGIFSIADISSVDGIAAVDVATFWTWYDPRIVFKNPAKNTEIDCNEIWTPNIHIKEGTDNYMFMNYTFYTSSCLILPAFHEVPELQKIKYDSYMGQYANGDTVPITFQINGLYTVPCRFDFQKYPFGIQTCNFSYAIGNAKRSYSKYKLKIDNIANFKSKDELVYFGSDKLGEFYFFKATFNTHPKDNEIVSVSIYLQQLSGFHIVNSFTPSFLICLISYSTLFFPLTDFNERIMVSLTSLLVLAALFTQASTSSVKTSYLKYLDIWFVSLIVFCFFVTFANITVHKMLSRVNNKCHPLADKEKQEELEPNSNSLHYLRFKKVNNVNKVFEALFSLCLMIFVVIFCLAANGTV